MKVLVTGASGFVGKEFCRQALEEGMALRKVLRTVSPDESDEYVFGDLESRRDWSDAMRGIDVVVHLAARVHRMREAASDPFAEYYKANAEVTKRLARQAAKAGVRRFVFVSSVKVNGEVTFGRPFVETDQPAPLDPYGRSKLIAEEELRQEASISGMEWVIVRPALVYGAGAKGNFLRLMWGIKMGMPFPLRNVSAPRSMVGVENLARLLVLCCTHTAAAEQIFLASDWAPSTVELISTIALAMERRARVWPFPLWLLKLLARLPGGLGGALSRLSHEFVVDSSKASSLLAWTVQKSPEDSVRGMVAEFCGSRRG